MPGRTKTHTFPRSFTFSRGALGERKRHRKFTRSSEKTIELNVNQDFFYAFGNAKNVKTGNKLLKVSKNQR